MSQSPRAGDEDLLKQTTDCPVLFSRSHDLRAINKLTKRLGIRRVHPTTGQTPQPATRLEPTWEKGFGALKLTLVELRRDLPGAGFAA